MPLTLQQPYYPQETDAVLRAFPAQVKHLMPAWEDIPEQFRKGLTVWNDMADLWFTRGVDGEAQFAATEGVPASTAFWHLHCILGSFEPKHEHKMAAIAYLSSIWFVGVRLHGTLFGAPWIDSGDEDEDRGNDGTGA